MKFETPQTPSAATKFKPPFGDDDAVDVAVDVAVVVVADVNTVVVGTTDGPVVPNADVIPMGANVAGELVGTANGPNVNDSTNCKPSALPPMPNAVWAVTTPSVQQTSSPPMTMS